MTTPPVLRSVDAITIPVPGLDEGLAFYQDRLGHRLLWRNDAVGQAGLALPDSSVEVVLTTRQQMEPNWLVESMETQTRHRHDADRLELELATAVWLAVIRQEARMAASSASRGSHATLTRSPGSWSGANAEEPKAWIPRISTGLPTATWQKGPWPGMSRPVSSHASRDVSAAPRGSRPPLKSPFVDQSPGPTGHGCSRSRSVRKRRAAPTRCARRCPATEVGLRSQTGPIGHDCPHSETPAGRSGELSERALMGVSG
jgi:catechol 2,3-dioxygenase-like lactoylglutathione lyase family enzyme